MAGEAHAQRSLAGYSPWGHKESDTTEHTHTHTHTHTSVSRPVRWRVVRSAAQLGAGSRWCLGSDGEVCCERTLGCGCSGLRSEYRSLPWAFLIWSLESARVAGARFQKERSLPHNTHFEPSKRTDLKDFFFFKRLKLVSPH